MFETERCMLSIFHKVDSEDVSKLFVNTEVRRYLGGVREPAGIEAALEEMLCSAADSFYWVVREKFTKEFIGLVSLDLHHDGVDQEVSYQFLPKWWGRGYATETVAVVIDFALNELQLPGVVAETQSGNQPSCRLLEKLGMNLDRKVCRYGAEQSIYAIRTHPKM